MPVGKGAKGLGVMLRGEVKKRSGGPLVAVKDFGFGEVETPHRARGRSRSHHL